MHSSSVLYSDFTRLGTKCKMMNVYVAAILLVKLVAFDLES